MIDYSLKRRLQSVYCLAMNNYLLTHKIYLGGKAGDFVLKVFSFSFPLFDAFGVYHVASLILLISEGFADLIDQRPRFGFLPKLNF